MVYHEYITDILQPIINPRKIKTAEHSNYNNSTPV